MRKLFHAGSSRIVFLAGILLTMFADRGVAQFAAQLISARSPGVPLPAGGNGASVDPQISPDGRFVLFNSLAANLGTNISGQLATQVYLRDRSNGTTTLISVNTNGFGGNGHSTYGGMSPDGRYVVFASDASDLVSGDTNGYSDVFRRDTLLGTTVLVSQSTAGVQGNGPSCQPVMTPDGRYVAFASASTNLAAAQNTPDVYLRDLTGQTTAAASSGLAAASTSGVIAGLSISTNGRYVAFNSTATNLAAGVNQTNGEIFVRDFVGGGLTWVSSGAGTNTVGLIGGSSPFSEHPVMSDDGSKIAFKTVSTGVANPVAVIFEYDMNSGTLTTVYAGASAAPCYDYNVFTRAAMPPYGDDLFGPEITPDGRFIVFTAEQQVTNAYGYIRLWDSHTQTSVIVSTNLSGYYPASTLAQAPSVSPDGRFVVFLSTAPRLTTHSVTAGFHIFQNDLSTGSITMLDLDTNGVGSTDFNGTYPSMSTNGQFIAFSGPDGALVPLDNNGVDDVFVRNTSAGATELISQRNPSVPVRSGDKYSAEGPLAISADGRWVAFSSYADDLVPGDTNNARDVFVCDRFSGSNILVSVAANGGAALGGDSIQPVISTNGQYVFFASAATNLTTGNVYASLPYYNIFRRDLGAQTTTLVSVSTNGVNAGNGDSVHPVISQDGRYVCFNTQATCLASVPNLQTPQFVIWNDLVGGTVQWQRGYGSLTTMSSDGRFVAYQPSGSVLQVWDTFGGTNIYTNTSASTGILSPNGSRLLYFNMSAPNGIKVQDLVNRTNMLTVTNQTISHAVVPSPGVWSGDSRFVVVVTTSAISPSDTNQSTDIYLFDLLNSSSTLVSVNYSLSGSGNTNSDSPIVSWDGRYVIFRSFATNIVPGHTTVPDLYLFDRIGGTNCLLAASQPASDWVSRSSQAGISVDVSTVVFQSYSSSLGIGHASRMQDVFAAVLPPAAARDSDGDGIPDWWMIQYFGHAVGGSWDQSLAQGDPNGTGMTTQQDYIAGTNPTDPNSVFEASVAAPPPPGGSITLTWDAIPGRTYSVQYKDNLTDPAWQTLPGAPAISGNQGQMAVPADQPTRYYRIVVQ